MCGGSSFTRLSFFSKPDYSGIALGGFRPIVVYFLLFLPLLPVVYARVIFRARQSLDAENKKYRFIKFALSFVSSLQTVVITSLYMHTDVMMDPISPDFQGWFLFWAWVCMTASIATPIALAYSYFSDREQVIEGAFLRSKTLIAFTCMATIVSFLYYSAEFRGYLAAQTVPEVFMSKTDDPELKGKHLFLLDQNEDSYAILTSEGLKDERAILIVRKDKYPIIRVGNPVNVLGPIMLK